MDIMESQAGLYGLVILAVLIIAYASWYAVQHLKKSQHQRHTQKVLESLGIKYLRDIALPDGLDGIVFIDYLLLIPKGIVVLDINYSEGHLFGGISVDQWTQVVNNKTYKFTNPLYANQTKCQAVLWNAENNIGNDIDSDINLDVQGWVVFSGPGDFKKGIPDQVCMIDDLRSILEVNANLSSPVNEDIRQIWDKLHDLSISTRTQIHH